MKNLKGKDGVQEEQEVTNGTRRQVIQLMMLEQTNEKRL